jgi:hypothetical protein
LIAKTERHPQELRRSLWPNPTVECTNPLRIAIPRSLSRPGEPTLAITHIHTYLVHPGKGLNNPPEFGGAAVPLSGKLFGLLADIYERSERECDIDISFNRDAQGRQQNACRDLILTYLKGPTSDRGRHIAERLRAFTTHRSGMGLLFLIAGIEGKDHKLIVSRFPADSGILAEESKDVLNVEFLERIFMKSAKSYKAVLYRDASLTAKFWTGRAVDKQLNTPETRLSNYWIEDFLLSDFRTTSAAGTRRLGAALREAARKAGNLGVKSEIAAAVTLATGLQGQRISINDFGQRLQLSTQARDAIAREVQGVNTVNEKFQFDHAEFVRQVAYRTIELDSGALLTAESGAFERVFQRQQTAAAGQERFTTEGKVVSEKLSKS